jgi:hypothetical protein
MQKKLDKQRAALNSVEEYFKWHITLSTWYQAHETFKSSKAFIDCWMNKGYFPNQKCL